MDRTALGYLHFHITPHAHLYSGRKNLLWRSVDSYYVKELCASQYRSELMCIQLLQQQYDINKSLLLHIEGAEREGFPCFHGRLGDGEWIIELALHLIPSVLRLHPISQMHWADLIAMDAFRIYQICFPLPYLLVLDQK